MFQETIFSRDLVKRIVERELLVHITRTAVFDRVMSVVTELDAETRERAESQLESAGLSSKKHLQLHT